MGVNSLPKTVTRQRRDCDLNPGPSAPESSTLTTRIPSHPACSNLKTTDLLAGVSNYIHLSRDFFVNIFPRIFFTAKRSHKTLHH